MYETYRLSETVGDKNFPSYAPSSQLLEAYLPPTDAPPSEVAMAPLGRSYDKILSDLRNMNRLELLVLFLKCRSPRNIAEVRGDWDGELLDNGGAVMTSVSSFLTDRLFGKGRKWNGKAFYPQNKDYISGDGVNRFLSIGEKGLPETEHKFDWSLESSHIDPKSKSLLLAYHRFQGRLSPWRGMRDEVRVLQVQNGRRLGDGGCILIGMGCMDWSGAFWRNGFMNCAPFCLYRPPDQIKI